MGSWERQQICSWHVACPYLYESALRNELPCHGRTYLINSVRLPSGSFCPCDGSTWQLPNCVATTATFRGTAARSSRSAISGVYAFDGGSLDAAFSHSSQTIRFTWIDYILSCSLLPSDMEICRWEHAGVSESQVFSIWLPHAWVASTRSPGDELI
ncbi:hypothetical protein PVAP13_3NG228126 [Panicum virgatum]|uniref:Uncharacterized protein n=1 Tax=Panicum virgatum TaxID=38727 RepID=A0A8T0UKE7_PANVG|nr:hypothetical protein PVAP13_3NG228126 [Panicum virgatum]